MTDAAQPVALEKLQLADFEPLVGQQFRIVFVERTEILTLTEATAKKHIPGSGPRAAFSLIFDGSSTDIYLPQAIYPLDHADLGRLELFLVAIGPGPRGGPCRYQAIFG
jgi:hypothetical protein